MERTRLDGLLAGIRSAREQTLAELTEMTEEEFAHPTPMQRWDDARRVLLRFGDHMREHANQVVGARAAIGQAPTMPQRMLAEAELAWGKLLGATIGLTDEAAATAPPDGGWSVEQVLEHMLKVEGLYLDAIRQARQAARE
jgi:hypothetical protein